MKKFFYLLTFLILCSAVSAHADTTETDFAKLYKFTNIPDFKLVHDIDPYQNEEYQKYAWSPFPLFRLSADMYFKNQMIPAGYYVLTPRNMNDRNYVFFKESGKVKYIIPVVKTEVVEPGFYTLNVPVAKTTKWQNFTKKTSDGFYKLFKNSSKKEPPPKSYIESTYIDGNMFLIVLYYGGQKYTMVLKSTRF